MITSINTWFLLVIFALSCKETWSLRDVRLSVVPMAVQRGHSATLFCQYDLEGAPLYSVKWYRGTHEFYRHSPSEIPANKVFPYPGIYVDEDLSNSSQVVLRDVSFGLSGNFSCEVTTDAPSFSTAVVWQQMSVIELPESAPVVFAERDRYTLGETLRANCTSPPSRPPAELSFQVNGKAVGVNNIERHSAEVIPYGGMEGSHRWSGVNSAPGGLQWSTATMSLQLSSHYLKPPPVNGDQRTSRSGNGLQVTCIAQINPGEYQRNTSVQLSTLPGEPVHQRGTYVLYVMSPSRACNLDAALQTLMMALIFHVIFTQTIPTSSRL